MFSIYLSAGIVFGLGLMVVLIKLCLTYHIEDPYLVVRLWGIPLRRLDLREVRRITKYYEGRAENWANAFFIRKRRLVLKRRTGFFRNFIISPNHRYTFKRKLKLVMNSAVEDDDPEE